MQTAGGTSQNHRENTLFCFLPLKSLIQLSFTHDFFPLIIHTNPAEAHCPTVLVYVQKCLLARIRTNELTHLFCLKCAKIVKPFLFDSDFSCVKLFTLDIKNLKWLRLNMKSSDPLGSVTLNLCCASKPSSAVFTLQLQTMLRGSGQDIIWRPLSYVDHSMRLLPGYLMWSCDVCIIHLQG